MTTVPSQYQSYIQDAANYLGIPYDVVATQIGYESSFNPNAVSPAGAEGIAQFEPGTFATYGPKGGSPYNVADAFAAYKNYMHHLLGVFKGSLQDALAGYNAGEGNISAGMGYANHILSVSGQSGSATSSGNGTGGSSSNSSSNNAQANIDPATLAEQYGFTQAFLNANPELKKIFGQAVAGQWSSDRFTAALENTSWYKTHSDTERKWLLQASTDPATAGRAWNQAQTHLNQVLSSIGAYGPISNANYQALLYDIVAKGWSDDQVKYFAGQYDKLINGKMQGDAETQYSNGLQYAYSMGVKMSDSWYQTQVQNIERGLSTFADMQAGIRNQAKAQYSQFAQQIDGGQTIQDLASPYIQQMSNILEVDGNELSPFDPTIKKALSYKDPTTGQMGAQPLWQFENTLRSDPRWLQTNNARDSIMTTAHGVLQQFGLAF